MPPRPAVCLSPVGMKRDELSNHRGNVMTVISDKIAPIDTTSDGLWDYFNPSLVSATDYYPFGMGMPGRAASTWYSYGFNGKDNINSIADNSNWQDYGARIYNGKLCRFLSEDPMFRKFPMLSTFQFSSNSPIQAVDLDGFEALYYLAMVNREGKAEITRKTHKELFQNSNERTGSMGTGTAYIAFNKKGEIIYSHYEPSFMDQLTALMNVGGFMLYGNASSSIESSATKTSGKIWGTIDVAKLLEVFDVLSNTHPEYTKPNIEEPSSESLQDDVLGLVVDLSQKEKKENSSNDDTTITIVTTKNMNSWKDGNTIIEIKDTTIKKKDTGKFVKLRNDKIE